MDPFHPRSFFFGRTTKDRRPITNRLDGRNDLRVGSNIPSIRWRDPVPKTPILGWRFQDQDGPGVLRPYLSFLPPEGTSTGKKSPTRLGSDSQNLPREMDGTHKIPNGSVQRTRTCLSARRDHGSLSHRFRVPLEPNMKGMPFKAQWTSRSSVSDDALRFLTEPCEPSGLGRRGKCFGISPFVMYMHFFL